MSPRTLTPLYFGRRAGRACFLMLGLPLCSGLAWADTPATGLSTGTYLQATLALLLIVGLLAGTAWLARKINGSKGFGEGGLKVLGGVALGPRERVVLIEAGNDCLVVGIVPGQIRTLHTLAKSDLPQTTEPNDPNQFARWLNKATEGRTSV